ncbi:MULTISPECIES: HEPN domain-containing protein [Pseudomonas]|uniref:HEPN domain-containing protein n=1 Tax=Pseudomonas TaxID=286 RepID=UPI0003117DF0|nr:HEPN domain-containing protein [Pseudomonas brassicacearum]MEE4072652.1 HEPN domain-containing protein [Pseudomonas viridiflava]
MDQRIVDIIEWNSGWRTTGTNVEEFFARAALNESSEKPGLITLIKNDPSLAVILSGWQVIGLSRHRVTPELFASWIYKKGIDKCDFERELTEYIDNDRFSAYGVVLLAGLEVDEPIDLGRFGRLTNIYQLPNKKLQLALTDSTDEHALYPQYSAALVIPMSHPVLIGQPSQGELPVAVSDVMKDLDDVINCLMLCSENSLAVQKVASSIIPADGVPSFGPAEWIHHSFHVRREPIQLADSAIVVLLDQLENLGRLSEKHREHVRLPIKKLNEYYSCSDLSDSAVYLRTSLESLFLDNDSGELSHRLSIRAAITMGGSIQQKLETYRMIKKAYEYGSKAVHRGRLVEKRNDEVRRTLDYAASVAKQAIKHFLASPIDDWITVELGGGIPPLAERE